MRRSDSAVPSVLPRPRWGSDSTRDDRAGDGEPRRASRAPVPWFGSLRLPFSSAYVRLRDRYIGCVGSGFGRRGSAPNALGGGGRWARSLRETGVGLREGTRSRGFGRAADARSAPGGLSSRYRGGPEAGSGGAGSGTGRGAKRCARRERVSRREKSRIPARGAEARGWGAGGARGEVGTRARRAPASCTA